eukprot:gene5546-5601_t
MESYAHAYADWQSRPKAWWEDAAAGIDCIRRLADGQDPNPPPTIDDVTALDDVKAALGSR